jgi:hypothetical protein
MCHSSCLASSTVEIVTQGLPHHCGWIEFLQGSCNAHSPGPWRTGHAFALALSGFTFTPGSVSEVVEI